MRLTNAMTAASIVQNPIGMKMRDTVMDVIGHLPRARKEMTRYDSLSSLQFAGEVVAA